MKNFDESLCVWIIMKIYTYIYKISCEEDSTTLCKKYPVLKMWWKI